MLCFLMPVCPTPPHPIISHLAQTKRSSHWFSLFLHTFQGYPGAPCLCVTFQSPSKRPAKPLCPSFVFRLPLSLLWKARAQNVNSSPCKNSRSFDCTLRSNGIRTIFTERGQFSIHRVTSYFTFLVSRQIRVIRAACAGVQNTAGIKDTNRCFAHSLTYC